MDYKEEAKHYSVDYLLKEINRLEKEIEKPLYFPSLNERRIRHNQEAWIEYYKRLLIEKIGE